MNEDSAVTVNHHEPSYHDKHTLSMAKAAEQPQIPRMIVLVDEKRTTYYPHPVRTVRDEAWETPVKYTPVRMEDARIILPCQTYYFPSLWTRTIAI